MSEPTATLEIPVEKDIPVVIEMLESEYENIRDEYEREEHDEMSDNVARKGSLCQELFAQLSNQGYSRFD